MVTSALVLLVTSKVSRWRFIAAVLGVPLLDALLGYLAFPAVWWLGNHGPYRPVRPEETALHFGLMTGALGYLVMLTAGIPVAVWLIRRGWTKIRT